MTSGSPRRLSWTEAYPGATAPVAILRLVVDEDVLAHDHDFMEVVLIFSGTGVHASGEGRVTLARGSVILLRPGTWHAYEQCRDLSLVNVGFASSLIEHELRDVVDARAAALVAHGQSVRHVLIEDEPLDRIDALTQLPEPRGLMGWSGILLAILEVLVDALPDTVAPMHPGVAAVLAALREAPERNWTLERLARRVGLNPSYLSRLFRAQTGLPPLAYLAQLRVERAATLLLRTDLPCGDVGHQVGWPDPNHFARRFRAHFGTSPSAYRASRYARSGLQ